MKFFGEELLLDEIRGIKYSLAYSTIYSYLAIHSLLYRAVPGFLINFDVINYI